MFFRYILWIFFVLFHFSSNRELCVFLKQAQIFYIHELLLTSTRDFQNVLVLEKYNLHIRIQNLVFDYIVFRKEMYLYVWQSNDDVS